jgi:hypothetical protein
MAHATLEAVRIEVEDLLRVVSRDRLGKCDVQASPRVPRLLPWLDLASLHAWIRRLQHSVKEFIHVCLSTTTSDVSRFFLKHIPMLYKTPSIFYPQESIRRVFELARPANVMDRSTVGVKRKVLADSSELFAVGICRKSRPEHGSFALRLFFGRLILNHIPVL